VEFIGDGADAENEDEEIEGVERPAEEAGDESIPLNGGEAAKFIEEFRACLPRAKFCGMLSHP
jgi:hypothetical protein